MANDISADGQFIVGSGTNPDGNPEAWIARLAPTPVLPGEYNHDGTVDAADYIVWRKGLGTTYTQDDYNAWQANFARTLLTGSGASSAELPSSNIPEPATVMLLALILPFVWRVRTLRSGDSPAAGSPALLRD